MDLENWKAMKRFISYASVAINSLRKRGLRKTFLFLIGEYWFDIRFQVNTRPNYLNGDSTIIGAHLPNAAPHYGTNWFVLKGVFGELIRKKLITPASAHMIDFGCGSGRALMAAQYFGIAKVTGVEFSKMLCLRAEENLRKFMRRNMKKPDLVWEVVHADACSFAIPQDATLFFLYNPFGSPVIDLVAQHVLEFAHSAKHTVTVIYVNPIHASVFEQLGYVKLQESSEEVAIYACS
jgi:SAM-dependent methyltransferase